MYQLYDTQINKDILASLSYIALESGINFSNKEQFHNILYKLYHFTKDSFVFNEGIQINEELKAKIEEFKNIYIDLPDPNIEDSEEFFGTVATNDSSGSIFANIEPVEAVVGEKKYLPYRFECATTGSYLYYRFTVYRASDGYERLIGASVSIPPNTSYFKLALEAQSTRYVVHIEFYSDDGSLLSILSNNATTSYSPTEYTTAKITYVYHTKATIDVYELTEYNFDITEDNLANIDTTSLVTGDVYYASEFIDYSNKKRAVRLYSLINKKINEEPMDKPFEEVEYLSRTEVMTGERNGLCDFFFVMKNEATNDYRAVISNYPLYYTDKNGEDGFWGVNVGTSYYFKVYESIDGYVFDETSSGVLNASRVKGNEYYVSSTPFHIKGYKLHYNNYPIYYSYRDYATLLYVAKTLECSLAEASEFLEDENNVMLFDEIEPRAYSDYSLVLYKNSNVQFPMKRLPLGAQVKLGHHRIEDSVKFPLVWKVLDYPSKMNGVTYPPKSVMIQTAFSIDAMQMGINGQIIYTPFDLLPYVRWANSEAEAGKWWSPAIENEKEPNADNCSTNGAYSHRAGFLYNWLKEEKELLLPITSDDYTNQRILNLLGDESPDSSTNPKRPKLFTSFGSSPSWVDNHYFTKHIGHHLNYKNSAIIDVDDYVCTLKSGSGYWRRQRETNNINKYGNTAGFGTDFAYNIRGISPMCCITEDVMVNLEPDANGIYSLDLDIEELIETKSVYDCERSVLNNFETSNDTELSILNSFENIFETFKSTGVSFSNIFDTFREVRNSINEKYSVVKHNVVNFMKLFETSRMHNYTHSLKFPTKIGVLANFEKTYATERNTNEEYQVSIKYETERRRLNSFVERFKTSLITLGLFEKSYQLHRFVRAKKEVVYETQIDTIEHREFDYPLQRFTLQNNTANTPTRIRVTNNFESVFETKRDTHVRNDYFFPAERKIQEPFEVVNENLVRFVEGKSESIYPTFRYMSEPTVVKYNCVRQVTERHALKYSTTRQIIKNLQALENYPTNRYVMANSKHNYPLLRKTIANVFDEVNLLRYVVQNIDFVANCERYILENITNNYELCRSIIEDFEKINEAVIYTLSNAEEEYNSEIKLTQIFNLDNPTLREVVDMIEINYPTKRATTVTTNKYVSKDNLMLYTVLLKQEIATFIEQKIKYELDKRGL